jgi:hypothetical protein
MEIVLGILLLFGAFTLGAVTSDSTDHETHTAHIESDEAGQHTQTVTISTRQKCQASGSGRHYRDLTVPIAQPVVQQPTQTDDDEDDNWDE